MAKLTKKQIKDHKAAMEIINGLGERGLYDLEMDQIEEVFTNFREDY